MDDASLDDFLGSDADEESATDSGDTPDDDSEAAEGATVTEPDDTRESPRVDPATVDPATVTSRWDGDGVACSSCGEHVERGWVAPDGIVCPSCKEWS